jgi:N-sulfoglucosamine sulfohydrolase
VREQLADYCAEVNRVDRTVAGVLDVLKKRSLMDSTIIVFCGDNGMAMPHGKGSLYDPGSNVPFLVRWPGVVKPGGESRALISGEDLAPTLLDAAGLGTRSKMSRRELPAPAQRRSAHAEKAPLRRAWPRTAPPPCRQT